MFVPAWADAAIVSQIIAAENLLQRVEDLIGSGYRIGDCDAHLMISESRCICATSEVSIPRNFSYRE